MNMRVKWGDAARGIESLLKEKDRYESVIRQTRWAEGSIRIVGNGPSQVAGELGARVFEWLLGWAVTVRSAAEFNAYALGTLSARSVLIAVSPSGEEHDLLNSARRARQRGAATLALTRDRANPLACAVHGTFVLPAASESPPTLTTPFLEQAALAYIPYLAARIYNPRHPQTGILEESFSELAARLEWMMLHLPDALRSLAARLHAARRVLLCAGGFYNNAALQAAQYAAKVGRFEVQLTGLGGPTEEVAQAQDAILFVSGGNCRVKEEVHKLASNLRARKIQLFSITDKNDGELIDASELAIVLPPLPELTGSLLSLACVEWLIHEHAQLYRSRAEEKGQAGAGD